MKQSNNSAAFSHSPFQALTVTSEGAISLIQPVNSDKSAKQEAKPAANPLPSLKVRPVRRPQPLIKKQPVRPLQTEPTSTKATTAVPSIFVQMKAAQQSRTSVSGLVTQVVDDGKGRIFGVRVKLDNTDVLAFAPFSRLGLAITEVHGLLNTTQAFKVIEVNESKGAIVFNRQAACSELRLDRLIDLVKVGQVLNGRIRNIADCGAFVEITGTGASGLIHISKLPGQSLDSVKKGEEVKVTVIKFNKAKHQLGLALAEVK